MNCHSQLWATSPYLEPVRESFRSGKSLEWVRVNDLPDLFISTTAFIYTKELAVIRVMAK